MEEITFQTKNPREAAYLAILRALREEGFVGNILNLWIKTAEPKREDIALAKEIVYGTVRMALALDHIGSQLAETGKLNIKLREKVLLRIAIYQHVFMERIPAHAIANETLQIAKKFCHQTFTGFLNAVLRRLFQKTPPLPSGLTVPELSTRYSYPQYYVQQLLNQYGVEQAKQIMQAGNFPPHTMARIRPGVKFQEQDIPGLELIAGTPAPFCLIKDPSEIPTISHSSDYYIQNITPASLITRLCHQAEHPKRILDLCASPGGKLLATYDHFPDADFFANDISEDKLRRLQENCTKYDLNANFSCMLGEKFESHVPFNIIILDVPCTNSGVLNKRPEARWRLSKKNLENLELTQLKLLRHAATLLAPLGEIWYITCSILKQENEHIVQHACRELGLINKHQETLLPNTDGWDGGFACALAKPKEEMDFGQITQRGDLLPP